MQFNQFFFLLSFSQRSFFFFFYFSFFWNFFSVCQVYGILRLKNLRKMCYSERNEEKRNTSRKSHISFNKLKLILLFFINFVSFQILIYFFINMKYKLTLTAITILIVMRFLIHSMKLDRFEQKLPTFLTNSVK